MKKIISFGITAIYLFFLSACSFGISDQNEDISPKQEPVEQYFVSEKTILQEDEPTYIQSVDEIIQSLYMNLGTIDPITGYQYIFTISDIQLEIDGEYYYCGQWRWFTDVDGYSNRSSLLNMIAVTIDGEYLYIITMNNGSWEIEENSVISLL